MTYIDLVNSFWDLATTNPLSTGQVSLYFALLHVCNRSYWAEWFQAPNQVLSVLTGLSRSGIQKARNELKQRGLIDFKERGTKATSYRLVMADSVQTDVLMANSVQARNRTGVPMAKSTQASNQDGVQNGVQNSNQDGVQNSGTLYKTKDRRQDGDRISPPVSPVRRLEEFWAAYPNRQRRGLAEKAYCDLLLSGKVTEDELVEAARNYAEHARGTGEKMYLPHNWLEKCVFEDFLPGNYAGDGRAAGHRGAAGEGSGAGRQGGDAEELAGDDWMGCNASLWEGNVWD